MTKKVPEHLFIHGDSDSKRISISYFSKAIHCQAEDIEFLFCNKTILNVYVYIESSISELIQFEFSNSEECSYAFKTIDSMIFEMLKKPVVIIGQLGDDGELLKQIHERQEIDQLKKRSKDED